MLAALMIETKDNHKVNNYLFTMKQIIIKCKVEIENMVDVNQGDLAKNKDIDQASVYNTQTYGRDDDSRGSYNNYRGNQGSHYNEHRGGYQSYKDNRKPINLDDRGNYLWDFEGNPIDASKEQDAAFALHSSSLENDRSDQGYGSGQKGGKGAQHGSRNQSEKRYCMVCKERGHNNLLYCSKLPEYIPGGLGVKPIPKELCKFCLSAAGNSKDCPHNYPTNYNDWICQQSKVNFILCKDCQKHQAPQDWLKENFNPYSGPGNLFKVWKEFNRDNAIIN